MDLRRDFSRILSYRFLALWLVALTFPHASARDQAKECFGIFESTGFRLELNPLMMEPILAIPESSPLNSDLQYVRIVGSKNVSHEFDGKSLAIVAPPRSERTTLEWTGLALDRSEVSVNTKFVNDSESTLEWNNTLDGSEKIFWAFDYGAPGQLNWTLRTVVPALDLENPCQNISFTVLDIRPDGNINETHKTCNGSSKGFLDLGNSSQALILLDIQSVSAEGSNFQVSWLHQQEPLNSNSKGIIATANGLVVIPFNSTQTKKSGQNVKGLVFDRNSRRIYWLEFGVGVMRSNLDGSGSEILVSDSSLYLRGMAVDPMSGNLYYGDWSSGKISFCSNDATKCSSIKGSIGVLSARDFAIHQSKGLLFQSTYGHQVVRANLDGSEATTILAGLDVRVLGIDVDEHEDRLYWVSNKGIGSCDLNGQDIQMLPNINAIVEDVAIDGDTIYYSNWKTMSIHAISKLRSDSELVANLTSHGHGYHIALFCPMVSNQPPNPCENSECAHLCVVTAPWAYRCICPDKKELNPDGKTCQLIS